jgi:iron complex outermembrane receptor protein
MKSSIKRSDIVRSLASGASVMVLCAAIHSPAMAQAAAIAPIAADGAAALDEVVIVGNRRATQVLESANAVDLLNREELDVGGGVSLQQGLYRQVPSFNFPQGQAARQGGGAARSASLRGQNPDLTLVLVDGKRRHGSNTTGYTFPYGGSGYADINAIPLSALSRVEVLLDGASAQYGSDAIAGVLNLILREDSSGGGVTLTAGQYKEGDGETTGVSGWAGFKLPGDGFLTLSGDISLRDPTDRSGPDIRPRYFRYSATGQPLPANSTAGTPDPREPFGRDQVGKFGNARVESSAFLANFGSNLSENLKVYGWANYAETETTSWVQPEVPSSNAVVRAIFPNGYQTIAEYRDRNTAAALGLKYDAQGLGAFDLSVNYGRHVRDTRNSNLDSPSYGLNSKTSFYTGQVTSDQLNVGLDYDRDFNVGWLAQPLAFQAGVSYRKDRWWVSSPGEEQSWNNGGVPILDGPNAGQPAGWGSSEQGIAPWDVTRDERDVYSLYAGADFHLTDKLLISGTIRGEDYSDFGSTATGKVSARYDFTPAFALRGTYSTGYHAPNMGQIAYQLSGYTLSWNHSGVVPVPNRTRQVRPGDPVAAALGGGPLEPETSKNASIGFVWRPRSSASVTVDAYQIDIDDRILLTQALTGPAVERVTAAAGIPDYKNITFLVNGLNTRTRGVDILARDSLDFGDRGTVDLSLGISKYKTDVTHVRPNTATGVDLFTRNFVLNPEIGVPSYKVILGVTWNIGPWAVDWNQIFYGEYTYVHPTNPAFDEKYGAKAYTNIEFAYNLIEKTKFSVGANNVFDTYPKQFIAANQVNGINRYSFVHPEGSNGAYYYTRLSHSF